MFFWFAGLPSQKCVCPSITKISSPLAVLYMAFLLLPNGLLCGSPLAQPASLAGIARSRRQMMYFIISFMSPNNMTVLSSVMTIRP